MKKIFILTFIMAANFMFAQQNDKIAIKWMTIEEATKAQVVQPKKIMMDAYTVWCGPCKMLDKNTFQNPDVVKYINKNYYAVKFNAEGNSVVNFKGMTFENTNYDPAKKNKRNSSHNFSQYLSISAYPTIVFLDENADLIAPIKGYKTPRQIELFLKLFVNDDYKNLTAEGDWENYQTNFKYEFRQ